MKKIAGILVGFFKDIWLFIVFVVESIPLIRHKWKEEKKFEESNS